MNKEMLKSMLTERKENPINDDFKTMNIFIVRYSDWAVILERHLKREVFFTPIYTESTVTVGESQQEWNRSQRLQVRKLQAYVFTFCVFTCQRILFCFSSQRCPPDSQRSWSWGDEWQCHVFAFLVLIEIVFFFPVCISHDSCLLKPMWVSIPNV